MSLDKNDSFHANGELMLICRGCTLSGELHVMTADQRCELCDGMERLTAKMVEDLAKLIPRKPRRTGSNPFFCLAEKYDLPLEVVYCYAQRLRDIKAQGYRHGGHPNVHGDSWGYAVGYWGAWAAKRLREIMEARADHRFWAFHDDVMSVVDPSQFPGIHS